MILGVQHREEVIHSKADGGEGETKKASRPTKITPRDAKIAPRGPKKASRPAKITILTQKIDFAKNY